MVRGLGDEGATRQGWVAVVPIRSFATAKSRLRDDLPAEIVEELARELAERVLGELSACSAVCRVLVVSDVDLSEELGSDDDTEDRFGTGRIEFLVQTPGGGLHEAVTEATTLVRGSDTASPILVLHADLPYVETAEIEALITDLERLEEDAFLADRAGTGTTLVALSPGSLRQTAFGAGSAELHRRLGFTEVLRAPGSGLRNDLDTVAHYLGYLESSYPENEVRQRSASSRAAVMM